jgi:hypothetical protein
MLLNPLAMWASERSLHDGTTPDLALFHFSHFEDK